MRLRRSAVVFATAAALASGAATAVPLSQANAAAPTNLYVSPSGSDQASGLSAQQPLKTIQGALNAARAGVTIHLAPGNYYENPITQVNGTASAPITIEGSDTGFAAADRTGTVLYGNSRVFTINNSYYRLQGFTINGEEELPKGTSYPTTLSSVAAFKKSVKDDVGDSTLIYIGGSNTARSMKGNIIEDMFLTDAGGSCVRIRDGAYDNQILNSTIQWCGMLGRNYGSSVYTYHNGEGIYIGTSPKSAGEPMTADDNTSYNTIKGNVIHTFGSECVDVKENAHNNAIVDNTCADNTEPLSDYGSNIELRGYDNSVVGNTISGSLGYGLKIASDSSRYAQGGNVVQSNVFSADQGNAIRNDQARAQGLFCGNTLPSKSYLHGNSVGTPSGRCPKTVN